MCPTLLQECTVKAHPEGLILGFLRFVVQVFAKGNMLWSMFKHGTCGVAYYHSQLLQITSLQMVQERLFQSRQDFPNKGEGSAV